MRSLQNKTKTRTILSQSWQLLLILSQYPHIPNLIFPFVTRDYYQYYYYMRKLIFLPNISSNSPVHPEQTKNMITSQIIRNRFSGGWSKRVKDETANFCLSCIKVIKSIGCVCGWNHTKFLASKLISRNT